MPPADSAHDANLLDIAPRHEVPDRPECPSESRDASAEDVHESEEPPPPKEAGRIEAPEQPWPVDVLLYPLRWISLIHLIGIWLLLFLICPFVMSCGLGMEYIPFVYALPIAYAVYYFAECLRDRAGGGRHMPDYWMHPAELSKWDCVTQTFEVLACIAVCFWPMGIYYGVRERADWIYWLLLAGGGFVFPMVLLSVVMFDSLSGLNPILIGGSILRTFVPYVGTVLLLAGIGLLVTQLGPRFRLHHFYFQSMGVILLRLAQLYLVFVAIAVLGTFCRRHQDRLDWAA